MSASEDREPGYRVLIFGSRDWTDEFPIWCVLNGYAHDGFPVTVLHGGARGADRIAAKWAKLNAQPCEAYLADWRLYGRPAAAFIRNQQMADARPDVAWGFKTGFDWTLEHGGSEDMARRLKAAFVPTVVVGAP